MGTYYYGNSTSIAPGITDIEVFNANNWIGSGFLQAGSTLEPLIAAGRIINHSWVGSAGTSDPDILRRFDFVINRDNLLSVSGLTNSAANPVPNLMAASYNGLVVGRSDASHSSGTTQVDTAGRQKPDLVVPINATSWAAPITAAAGALLIEHADTTAGLALAANTEVIKAALMAGATKEESFNWTHTAISPLDETYGAGQLNIYNSYHIIDAGRQQASDSTNLGLEGWDFNNSSNSSNLLYFFEVPEGEFLEDFSLILTWNRLVTDGLPGPSWGSPTVELKNLDLRFFAASNFILGEQLDASFSSLDNVEHIYRTSLQSGQYAVQVVANNDGNQDVDFAVAWTATVIPEPASGMLILTAGSVWILRRRRTRAN